MRLALRRSRPTRRCAAILLIATAGIIVGAAHPAFADVGPGTTVPVKVVRDGTEKSLRVTVAVLPGSDSLAKAGSSPSDTGTLNGVGVGDLDDEARQQFNIPADVKGAVVTDVAPDSPAAEAGLKPGDVIEQINRKEVKNAGEAVRLTEHPKDKVTLLRVWSEGNSRFLVVDESKAG